MRKMCLILLSYRMHDRYPFILAANRDEFYERPSAPVSLWDDAPGVIAGKDLKSGGTWLGISKKVVSRRLPTIVTRHRSAVMHLHGGGW